MRSEQATRPLGDVVADGEGASTVGLGVEGVVEVQAASNSPRASRAIGRLRRIWDEAYSTQPDIRPSLVIVA